MKIWIGHYEGNPKEWFVVWANNKDEAFLQIDSTIAEPDMDSLKELNGAGFVNFTVDLRQEEVGFVPHFMPPKEDVETGFWLVLEDDDADEHIIQRIRNKNPKKR